MTGRDAFKIWAPAGARWTEWARPVPFIAVDKAPVKTVQTNIATPQAVIINTFAPDTAIFVDLYGDKGVEQGIALAKLGYRPVPLYNGTNCQLGAIALVDNSGIEGALLWGASELAKLDLPDTAPPAFLLDTCRMHRKFKTNLSIFDNSWDLYEQDIPSAEFFLRHRINKIVITGQQIQKDLKKIFYKFQNKGIKIFFTEGFEEANEVSIKKPRRKDR